MFLSKQELATEIANLNDIGVSEHDLASLLVFGRFACSNTQHGIIFQQLTSDRTSTNHEQFCIGKFL